ncbi:MAG: SDR family oxidoreductase [Acidobacteria bacterium]|nr:MAG: SDR family oxidoreductase [Acidobacteriota bacterium]RPI20059.1 MAG: SDR family oxidoreductase [Acidobacteriota bacterium]
MTFLESTFGLQGKTAVITGGAGTLCGAIGEAYIRAGGNVILWDIRAEALSARVGQLNEACGCCGRVDAVEVDLLNEPSIQEALTKSVTKFGRVDVLVNGAGGNRGKCALTDVKEEDFEFVLKLNLIAGCLLPTKHFARYWIENRIRGAVLNIASMAAFSPLSGVWAYSAAKAAVMNQTMAHAKELAPWGIRVNGIAPGFFVADQNRRLLLNEDGSLTQRGRDVIAHTPMQRFGDPNDLAAAAVFLAADGAAFVSGVTLPVDGAFLCHSI